MKGINHVTFSVSDLDESFGFYVRVLGCRPVARWNTGAYLLVGEAWVVLILDENTPERSPVGYTHLAFSVAPENFDRLAKRIEDSGARIWQENLTEGDSLYFTDPDGHRLEIHVSDLESRLRADREDPPEGMEFYM